MKKGLVVPLTMAQIEAANEPHQGLPQWKNADDALHALHNRFPEFDIKATLLKVAAVNQLYGTNVYAVDRMARHIVEVLWYFPHSAWYGRTGGCSSQPTGPSCHFSYEARGD